MALKITAFPAGPVETNGYVVMNDNGDALVIDAPQGAADPIVAALREAGATATAIVITHPHWDHFAGAAELREKLGVPLIAHSSATPRLADPASSLFPLPENAGPIAPVTPDVLVEDGGSVALGDVTFSVIFVPGHEPSHIALYQADEKVLFGGDVIFPGGPGTIEIPGADADTIQRSLARLAALPDDVTVYPGHGTPTTIRAERGWLPPAKGTSGE